MFELSTFSALNDGSLQQVYIAPLKALVQEKHRDWSKKFGQTLNMKCQELTGDTELSNIRQLQEVDIILTTPEVNPQKY